MVREALPNGKEEKVSWMEKESPANRGGDITSMQIDRMSKSSFGEYTYIVNLLKTKNEQEHTRVESSEENT